MPSKPRKLSTAIDSAVPIRPGENWSESKSGLVLNSAPLVPCTIAITAITMKIATKIELGDQEEPVDDRGEARCRCS